MEQHLPLASRRGSPAGQTGVALEAFARLAKAIGKTKHPYRSLGAAVRHMVLPLGSELEREGQGAGKPLMEALRLANNLGEIAAGGRLLRLADACMDKFTRDQLFNLLDVLEGRARPGDEAVREAAAVARELLDEIGGEAEDLEVMERYSGGRRLPGPVAAASRAESS